MRFVIDVPGDNRITEEKISDAKSLLDLLKIAMRDNHITIAKNLSMVGTSGGKSYRAISFDQGVRLKYCKGIVQNE